MRLREGEGGTELRSWIETSVTRARTTLHNVYLWCFRDFKCLFAFVQIAASFWATQQPTSIYTCQCAAVRAPLVHCHAHTACERECERSGTHWLRICPDSIKQAGEIIVQRQSIVEQANVRKFRLSARHYVRIRAVQAIFRLAWLPSAPVQKSESINSKVHRAPDENGRWPLLPNQSAASGAEVHVWHLDAFGCSAPEQLWLFTRQFQ